MTQNEIAKKRLIAQQVVDPRFETAAEITNWMGALQAQDFAMAKWALGLRLKDPSEKKVHEAIDTAQILRTHVLRPTWHFISASDIYWMLSLSAPKIKAGMKGRHRQLELSEKLLKKCNDVLGRSLTDSKNLTRKQLVEVLQKAKIPTDNNRASHLFLNAELEGILCSGKMKGKETTYALLDERVPEKRWLTREEALYRLAKKYFQSHSPATLQDFIWWSGLSAMEAKKAISSMKKELAETTINDVRYLFVPTLGPEKKTRSSVFLLPAFDEYLISYKDRSVSIANGHQSKAFSKNGIFWPTIVTNGKVEGTWKREIKKDKTVITTCFFDSKVKASHWGLNKVLKKFSAFSGRKVELKIG